jgi:hypothetical protein
VYTVPVGALRVGVAVEDCNCSGAKLSDGLMAGEGEGEGEGFDCVFVSDLSLCGE